MLWWTLRRLRANNPEVRWRAVATLLKRRDVSTVGILIAALDDFSSEVRILAARALGEIADPQAVEPLVLALKTWSRWDRWAAIEALVKVGGAAVEPLIEALTDLDVEVRKAAVEVLEKIGDTRAIALLRTVLEYHDYAMRQHAAKTLESLGWQPESAFERVLQHIATGCCEAAMAEGPEAVETLLAALKLNDAKVRAEVAITLGRLGDVRALEPLVTALVDLDADVRLAAAEALTHLSDRRAFEALLAALKDRDANGQSRLRVVNALGLMGDARAIEPLLAATTDADQAVRRAAAQVLGEIKGAETVTPLLTALKTKDETVGDHASKTLAKLGHSAVAPLLAAMKDEDPRVCTRAAKALTKIGNAAVGPLLEALQDTRRDVRQSAAEALPKAGDKWAVEPLVTMLWDPDSDVRQAAAESLTALGWQPIDAIERARETVARRAWPTAASLGMAAVEPLQDALQDRRQDVRRGAAEALTMLGWQSAAVSCRPGARSEPREGLSISGVQPHPLIVHIYDNWLSMNCDNVGSRCNQTFPSPAGLIV
jgi:HEAT repeat protein